MSDHTTPLMRQYFALKEQYPDFLLLFQVGDFYELFFEDAVKAAACLSIVLTKRGNHKGQSIPLCGVPVHALDNYLIKLIRAGFKVAIADQLEEARPGKVVDRGITRILTPGTLIDANMLDAKTSSYLMVMHIRDQLCTLIFLELLTNQLYATKIALLDFKTIESELLRFFPDEIIISATYSSHEIIKKIRSLGFFITILQEQENTTSCAAWLKTQFTAPTFEKISAHYYEAFYLLFSYLEHIQCAAKDQLQQVNWYAAADYVMIDASTIANLEIVTNVQDGSKKYTLFSVLDRAVTAMGSRMIKKWLLRPLINPALITQRLDAVEELIADLAGRQQLKESFGVVQDVERIIGRIILSKGQLSDYVSLTGILHELPTIKNILCLKSTYLLRYLYQQLGEFNALKNMLELSLNNDTTKPWLIKEGYNEQLDAMRSLVFQAQEKIAAMELFEREKTGIQSLKIRYNQVQGYYIEITKTHKDIIPVEYIRLQTLAGRERFITPALQQLQQEIIQAQQEVVIKEKEIFQEVKLHVFAHHIPLRKMAHALAYLDALYALAESAYEFRYVRPIFNDQQLIQISKGRHPIVEQMQQSSFIANDCYMDNQSHTWIITGPNMGGKSTYLRQVALICIMAQIGSFVPAQQAQLPIVDRIFSRIGSGDNLAQGKSTFLVEMEEAAYICDQATEKSLIILDEIGRGTSTFDGLSIAQAIIEHIHTHIKARCLFATHFHELTELTQQFPNLKTYYMASTKTERGILFSHQLCQGIADGSFGIEVAKLAQLPESIIVRARIILQQLQEYAPASPSKNYSLGKNQASPDYIQHMQAELAHYKKWYELIKNIDYHNLSPKQAFDVLWEIKEKNS